MNMIKGKALWKTISVLLYSCILFTGCTEKPHIPVSFVTVKTDDGGMTATCEIVVLHQPQQNQDNDSDNDNNDSEESDDIKHKDNNHDPIVFADDMIFTKKTFKSFDELQYFTLVTTTPQIILKE